MNYIAKLQNENQAQAREITALRDGLAELRAYVLSAKFASEGDKQGYVSVQDITLRIRETENHATYKREEVQ